MNKYVHKHSDVFVNTIYKDVKPLKEGLINDTVNDKRDLP